MEGANGTAPWGNCFGAIPRSIDDGTWTRCAPYHYGHFGQSLGNFSVALYGAHTAELQDSVGQQLQYWIESQISESRERCKALIDRYTHVDAGSHVAEVVTLKKAFCPAAQAGRMQVGKAASMHIFPTLYVSLRVVMPSDQNASTS